MAAAAFVGVLDIPTIEETTLLSDIFGRTVEVDEDFEKFLELPNGVYPIVTSLTYRAYLMGAGATDISIKKQLNLCSHYITPTEVWSTLRHWGTRGSKMFRVSEKRETLSVILGYAAINGREHVLFVRHEFKGRREKVCLRVRLADRWPPEEALMALTPC